MSRDDLPVFALRQIAVNSNKSKLLARAIRLHATIERVASKPMKWHIIFETAPSSSRNNLLISNIFKILKMRSRQQPILKDSTHISKTSQMIN